MPNNNLKTRQTSTPRRTTQAAAAATRRRSATASATPVSPEIRPMMHILPDPEDLAKYEKIVPGGAERIIELAEQQAAHDQALEARRLETSARLKLAGQLVGFILAFSAGAIGAALLLQGSELAGLIIILIDAAALMGVHIYGKH